MVQGKTKGLQVKAANPRHAQKAAANLKKGRVAIPPKKAPLVKQDKLRKVCRHLVAGRSSDINWLCSVAIGQD
jgi:Protein of unknown function (DUF2462)